jgi:hypothetical protein
MSCDFCSIYIPSKIQALHRILPHHQIIFERIFCANLGSEALRFSGSTDEYAKWNEGARKGGDVSNGVSSSK